MDDFVSWLKEQEAALLKETRDIEQARLRGDKRACVAVLPIEQLTRVSTALNLYDEFRRAE